MLSFFLSVQHCSSGAPGAVTRFAVVDRPRRALLIHDFGQPRQPARMSHHPVDRASPSRSACMLRDGMREIAISVGTVSLARTSAHWRTHVLFLYPFYPPHRSSYRWERAALRSTFFSLRNLQFCAIPASQFTKSHRTLLNATTASFFSLRSNARMPYNAQHKYWPSLTAIAS